MVGRGDWGALMVEASPSSVTWMAGTEAALVDRMWAGEVDFAGWIAGDGARPAVKVEGALPAVAGAVTGDDVPRGDDWFVP